MQWELRKWWIVCGSRRGSTTVLALMVSMFLTLLITSTMLLTMADINVIRDHVRNRRSFQAADSGIDHGKHVLAKALSKFTLSPATTPDDVSAYADDAESGDTSGDTDISLLVDTAGPDAGGYLGQILERQAVKTTNVLQSWSSGLNVQYQVDYNVTPTSVDRPDPDDISKTTMFHYDYDIKSRGQAYIHAQHNKATRQENGTFDVKVYRPSFATYAYFTQGMKNQFGDQLVFYDGEVFEGPVHVNSAPPEGRAGFYGQPVFNGHFSAVQEYYEDSWLGGNAEPQFNGGVEWGVDPIELPANGWSQYKAAVGDMGDVDNPTPLSNSEIRTFLDLPASSDPIDQGVYYSGDYNSGSSLNGGILVNGDAAIRLKQNGTAQIIQITMKPNDGGHFDSGGSHMWEFQDDIVAGTVKTFLDGVQQGTYYGNLNGMIHVEGSVTSLTGKNDGNTADIQADHQLTLSVINDVHISDNITYEVDPTLDSSAKNVLGIYSASGNVILDKSAPNDLKLDATVMAASPGHGVGAQDIVVGGAYDYDYPNKGNWNLLGGVIENENQTTGVRYSDGHATGYTWDFTYDQRFSSGVAPPYFPYVTRFLVEMQGVDAQNWGRRYY